MQQGKLGVTSAVRAEELRRRELRQPVQLIVGSQFCAGILKEGPEPGKLKDLHC
jgi:hypothetical protein